ncbi:MAG: hypothetical protein LBL79_12710 [Prevotella sp.]|jgi:hypothetical protein|nr:hypothetical protein [Prevotella sp.]
METKEKKLLKLFYRDSGVKTLEGIGVMMFIIGGLCIFVGVVMLLSDDGDTVIAVGLLASLFPFLFFGAVCTGLSSIAKTALYQRTVMESQYEFRDTEKDGFMPKSTSESKSVIDEYKEY